MKHYCYWPNQNMFTLRLNEIHEEFREERTLYRMIGSALDIGEYKPFT